MSLKRSSRPGKSQPKSLQARKTLPSAIIRPLSNNKSHKDSFCSLRDDVIVLENAVTEFANSMTLCLMSHGRFHFCSNSVLEFPCFTVFRAYLADKPAHHLKKWPLPKVALYSSFTNRCETTIQFEVFICPHCFSLYHIVSYLHVASSVAE